MLMKFKMTDHALERLPRLAKCIEKIGVGDVVLYAKDELHTSGRVRWLTSTGLILIVSEEGNVLITGYMGSMSQVVAMYKANGIDNIPSSMRKTVRRNAEKHKDLFKI